MVRQKQPTPWKSTGRRVGIQRRRARFTFTKESDQFYVEFQRLPNGRIKRNITHGNNRFVETFPNNYPTGNLVKFGGIYMTHRNNINNIKANLNTALGRE